MTWNLTFYAAIGNIKDSYKFLSCYEVDLFALGKLPVLVMKKPAESESSGAKSQDHMETVELLGLNSGKISLQLLWEEESEW